MNECGRCGITDRGVKMSLAHVHREQRQDGLHIQGPEYDHGYRCVDRDACRARVQAQREAVR